MSRPRRGLTFVVAGTRVPVRCIHLVALGLVTLGLVGTADAATVVLHNLDGAGEGFNDPTPIAPSGGNPGNTRGSARLLAFQQAANAWGSRLQSAVTIEIDARFDPLTPCTATSGVLGWAGSTTVHRNFTGAPVADTLYPQALANSLAGLDLAIGTSDISATFNSDVDNAACLGTTNWYYGFDGNAGSNVDFVSIVFHELGHGLGFISFVNVATGEKLGGFNDAYSLYTQQNGAVPADFPSMTDAQRVTASQSDPNLVWVGPNVTAASGTLTAGLTAGHVRLFGPNPQQPGSSVSHFSTATFPNQIMEPNYTGPNHDPGLALPLLNDLGWRLQGQATAVPSLSRGMALLLALLLGALALLGLARHTPRRANSWTTLH